MLIAPRITKNPNSIDRSSFKALSNFLMLRGLLCFLIVNNPLVEAADGEISDPTISAGGITALVLLVVFSLVLVGSCVYQARRMKSRQEPLHRVLRCGGCRRAFRVPASVDGAEFMCSRCVTEGRRRMSEVLEDERVARFARMRESANKTVKLERVTSTFFKIARRSLSNLGRSASLKDGTSTPDTGGGESKGDNGNECKICFDDESCIVLLPCLHAGLCEGCAKDLVTMTKECYICRQEIELIAKIKRPVPTENLRSTSNANDERRLSACLVAPDTLHHLASRRNTMEEAPIAITRRGTEELTTDPLPTLLSQQSRRNTLNMNESSLRPEPIEEEPTSSGAVETV